MKALMRKEGDYIMSEVANTILFWAWSLSLIAFIVYWRKKVNAKKEIGTNPEKYTKVAKIKRIIGIFCALSFAGFFFNSSNVSIDTPTKSAKVEQTDTKKVEKEKIVTPEETKAAFEDFYKEFNAIDKDVKRAWNNNWVPTMNGLSTGQVDRYLAYENMKIMQEYFQRQRLNASNKLEAPDSLDSKAKSKVENAIKNYQVALAARCDAADAMRDLLNKGNIKPSDLDDVKWKLGMAESSEAEAAKNIAEVARQLGVSTTTEE